MNVSAKLGVTPTAYEFDFGGEMEDYNVYVISNIDLSGNDSEINPLIYPNPDNSKFLIDLKAA